MSPQISSVRPLKNLIHMLKIILTILQDLKQKMYSKPFLWSKQNLSTFLASNFFYKDRQLYFLAGHGGSNRHLRIDI